MLRALPLLAAACSFSPPLVEGQEPVVDAVLADAKPDSTPVDAMPIDLDAPDASALVPDAGCGEPPFDPVCDAEDLGSLSGDTSGSPITRVAYADRWYHIRITENSGSKRDTRAYVQLEMPADVDFDLEAYCVSCGGTRAALSDRPQGSSDHFVLYNPDHGNGSTSDSDTFEVWLHIDHWGGASCGTWTLTITGNTTASTDFFYCDD